jgi:hypothetical protein
VGGKVSLILFVIPLGVIIARSIVFYDLLSVCGLYGIIPNKKHPNQQKPE